MKMNKFIRNMLVGGIVLIIVSSFIKGGWSRKVKMDKIVEKINCFCNSTDKKNENTKSIIHRQKKIEEDKEMVSMDIENLKVGDCIEQDIVNKVGKNEFFTYVPINDEIFRRMQGKSYKENSKISREDLVYLRVLHYGLDGRIHCGELVVNSKIKEKVLNIFKELYEVQYPIEKMILVDYYDANDILSMEDNNSSAFNYRTIDGSTTLSNHSMGLAIDINPLYNPYVREKNKKTEVLPASAVCYANREQECKYYIRENDCCVSIFKKYGFTWGGEWKKSKDYQHFEISLEEE